MSALDVLQQEHRELIGLFDELELTTDAVERTRLLAAFALRLKAHADVEEEVFYPAVRGVGPDDAAAIVDASLAAHRAADLLLDESMGAEPTEANVKVLREVVEKHIHDEEQQVFPLAEQLGAAELARLGLRIERRETELDGTEDDDAALVR